jgi:aminoglycoside 3-N-acetyltransferase
MLNTTAHNRRFQVAELVEALRTVQVQPGDTVMMHSSLLHLGRPSDCSLGTYPQTVVETVLSCLGDQGTLAVPAPNWDYGSKGVPFDVSHSSVERSIGVVSAHVVSRQDVARSANPIFSVAAIGRSAQAVCRPHTGSAFGVDSAWDRLFSMDAKLVLLGSGIETLSFVRYIEFRFGVPYLYNKLFSTAVLEDGTPLRISVTAPLRYRHCPAIYELRPFSKRLRNAGVLHEAQLGDGIVSMVTMSDCYRIGIEALRDDIHFFLKEPPKYLPDAVPVA